MNIILFNGPPRSGKDTAAGFATEVIDGLVDIEIAGAWPTPVWEKFSFPIKRAFAGMMKCPIDSNGNVTPWEACKDQYIPWLGASYRQWQIDFSEKFMKPLYGRGVFGRLFMLRQGEAAPNEIIIVSDCGFAVEVDCLKNQNVLLIRMYRDGCVWDSRERVEPHKGWTCLDYANNGTVEELEQWITNVVVEWVEKI